MSLVIYWDKKKNSYTNRGFCTAHDLKIKEGDNTPRYCPQFNKYAQKRGYTGYDSKTHYFVDAPQSIMAGSTINLEDRWMDRDTYITAFNHLKNPSPDPVLTLFSGIYIGEEFFDAKVTHHGSGILHPLSTDGDLRVMLKNSSGLILSESRV